MKFSEQWLRAYVNPPQSAGEIASLLTMAGLEVEALEPVAPAFSGVVVARILEAARHPDADRLQVCRVDAGGGQVLQIVCGAPNARPGITVPLAAVGAALPGISIGKARVRGIESFGMLCSAKELGLAEDASGLLELPNELTPGNDLRSALALDDQVFTLKLTPNRADCLGVVGVAREVAALTGAKLRVPSVPPAPVALADRLPIQVQAPELCGRFSGRVIKGVNPRARTPDWMQRRLERAGQRCISVLVDISNYVMLELNRPNHVFDLDKVEGGLEVRWARQGERLLLLNGQEIELQNDVGVIAGPSGVESLAGIMGGEATSVTLDTCNVYVEAAFWWPDAIAGRARRYGFTSEAGHRFERGVDYADTVAGVERVSALILEICGGQAGPLDDQQLNLPQRSPVQVRAARAGRVIGVPIPSEEIAGLFGRLGFEFEQDGEVFRVTAPTYRFDLQIEEDLIEEIARVYGYDRLPAVAPLAGAHMRAEAESVRSVSMLRRLLVDRDYQEVITYSFVDAAWEADFSPHPSPVALVNPIASQMGVMRSTLLGGLVNVLASNIRRQVDRVRVFEVGRCFLRGDGAGEVPGYHQPMRIAGLAWGDVKPLQWGEGQRGADFFDVKGDVEALLSPLRAEFEVGSHPAFHPGRCARVLLEGRELGFVGELHPRWAQRYELGRAPVAFELDVEMLLARHMPAFAGLSRFPVVVRDVALVVGENVAAAALQAALESVAGEVVQSVSLFDVYRGKGIGEGEKSLAFRIVMQDTQKTLSDDEADAVVKQLLDRVLSEFAARLRQ